MQWGLNPPNSLPGKSNTGRPGQLAATADLAVSAGIHSVHYSLRRADKHSSGKACKQALQFSI